MHYDPFGRRPRRRELPPQLIARFEKELAAARRERDEWEERYHALYDAVTREREQLDLARGELEEQIAVARAELSEAAEAQRERLRRNEEQRASGELRALLLRLVEVADNFERALAELPSDDGDPLVAGVLLTQRDLARALETAGVERLESVGEPFDPARHEAVATRADDAEPGTVLEQIAPGYLFRGGLLRPARVIVAAG